MVSHVCKYEGCFGKKSVEAIKKLKAAPWLESHIANQPLDMMMYLVKKGNKNLVGFILRNKTPERIARKVAENFVTLLKKYDSQLKGQRKKKKTSGSSSEDFAFKDMLFADQMAFSEVFAENVDFDYDHIFRSDKFVQLGRRDVSSYYIKPKELIRHDRIKVLNTKKGIILDFHANDMPGIAAREAGEAAHHIFVARKHHDLLSDKSNSYKTKLSYGKIYKEIYTRALKFFNASTFVSIEPTIFDYSDLEEPSEKAKYLANLRRRIADRLDFKQEDIEKFLHKYASLAERNSGQEKVHERMKNAMVRRYGGKDKFYKMRKKIEGTLYNALACHFLDLHMLLSDDSSRFFDYSVAGVNLGVSIKTSVSSTLKNLDFLSKLHFSLYNGTVYGRLLKKEKESIDAIKKDIEQLDKEYEDYLAFKEETIEKASQNPNYKKIRDFYFESLADFRKTDYNIASTHSDYASLTSQKTEVRLIMRIHRLELQYKLFNALKLKGKPTEKELSDFADQLIKDKNVIDSFYQATEKSLPEEIKSMYLQQKERFEGCVEANHQPGFS
ncbi:hypothetical protein KY339_05635 [Candidatus Woesearchaeota archaeon]|nr:hypothetical protein [Candidatus Woesearchaeota archaeon]